MITSGEGIDWATAEALHSVAYYFKETPLDLVGKIVEEGRFPTSFRLDRPRK